MLLTRIFVLGAGVVNPLGNDSEMIAVGVNADISVVTETDLYNKRLKPIKMAIVPEEALAPLNAAVAGMLLPSRQERMLRMAGAALLQLQSLIPHGFSPPLVIALPELIPNISQPWQGNIIEQLILQSGIEFDLKNSLVAEIGRAGGLYAIESVFKLMEAGHDWVLLGGMDSYWDPELLARLDAHDRLLVSGALDGFQPGEGASFVLLANEYSVSSLPIPHITLYRPGNSEESGHRYSDQPYRGDGLANAVRDAIANAPGIIDTVWTSMIYDSLCSKELGVALTRSATHFSQSATYRHPADCFGDIGAAVGPTLISLIGGLALRGKEVGRHHLLCCSSDTACRSAVRLDIHESVRMEAWI